MYSIQDYKFLHGIIKRTSKIYSTPNVIINLLSVYHVVHRYPSFETFSNGLLIPFSCIMTLAGVLISCYVHTVRLIYIYF
jgi:hypothetical protein